MAGYSSNTATSTQSRTPGSPATSTPPRTLRGSVSKHFSTTVPGTLNDTSANVHPLRQTWVIYFREQRSPGNKISGLDYEAGIKKIGAFSSVESFWTLWSHLNLPSALLPTTDYLLFHDAIVRPVWEDPLNIQGGKWIIRLKKGIADRLFEDLVLAIIGDQFDDCKSPAEAAEDEWPEICGCTISVRQSEDIISLWNRVDVDVMLRERIKDTIRKVLNLSPATLMEYKSNNDSMQDKSSFRNTAVDRTPLA